MKKKKKKTINIGRKVKKDSKRGRQYEHIKKSALDSGHSEKQAKTIAAATTNKQITKLSKKKKKARKKKKNS